MTLLERDADDVRLQQRGGRRRHRPAGRVRPRRRRAVHAVHPDPGRSTPATAGAQIVDDRDAPRRRPRRSPRRSPSSTARPPASSSAYPCGGAVPDVSNVNWGPGEIVAGAAFVPVAADGTFCVFTQPRSTSSSTSPGRSDRRQRCASSRSRTDADARHPRRHRRWRGPLGVGPDGRVRRRARRRGRPSRGRSRWSQPGGRRLAHRHAVRRSRRARRRRSTAPAGRIMANALTVGVSPAARCASTRSSARTRCSTRRVGGCRDGGSSRLAVLGDVAARSARPCRRSRRRRHARRGRRRASQRVYMITDSVGLGAKDARAGRVRPRLAGDGRRHAGEFVEQMESKYVRTRMAQPGRVRRLRGRRRRLQLPVLGPGPLRPHHRQHDRTRSRSAA